MKARQIREAQARLREAGARLRRRPARETLAALGSVLDALRDPASPSRRELESELAVSSGFAPAMLREGLSLALESWSSASLHELVSREIGDVSRLDGGPFGAEAGAVRAAGFELTSVILAGALPTPTLLALVAPLVLRSPVLAKSSSHDPVTARVFARALFRADRELGECLEVVSVASSEEEAMNAILAADCVVATGADETLARVAARVAPPRRLVGYGHRLSLAALGPQPRDDAALADAAQRLALDVALWDQLGCLSPLALFVVGAQPAAQRAARALADALAARENAWPRGGLPPEIAAAIRRERDAAEMRGGGAAPVEVMGAKDTAWTVVLEADARWRAAPLHRFLRVHPLARSADLVAALRPLAPHLAAVALEGFGPEQDTLAAALAGLGASRLCRFGRLQAPPLGWHHDGRGVLAPLVRFTDRELDS